MYSYLNDVATALPVVLQESGPDGNISYAFGLGLVSESSPAFDFFYHYDGLGSVIGLTDSSGKLAGRYLYDAWGQANLSVPDTQIGTKNKFRFTGEALDPGTQLYYLRARYYDSSSGRFMSKDPLAGFLRSPSVGLNRYSYAGNSPLNYVDPTGLSFFGNVLDAATEAVTGGAAALALSVTTTVGGTYVGFYNFLSGGRFGGKQLEQGFKAVQQGEARVLVESVARLEGVSISTQERIDTAATVVDITNLASSVLSLYQIYKTPLPNLVQDHNLLTAVHNPFYLLFQEATDITGILSTPLDIQDFLTKYFTAQPTTTANGKKGPTP
jgi:RHS repeat-associated protein